MAAWCVGAWVDLACDQGQKRGRLGVEGFLHAGAGGGFKLENQIFQCNRMPQYASICNISTPHSCKKFPLIHFAFCSTGCLPSGSSASSLAQAIPSGEDLVIKLRTCQDIGQHDNTLHASTDIPVGYDSLT